MSPTQRTLAALRAEGWECAVVERWNPHARITQDLYGWCDILAVRAVRDPYEVLQLVSESSSLDEARMLARDALSVGRGTLGIQTTSAPNAAARRAKLSAEPRARLCAEAGWRVEVWGWDTRRAEAPLCPECAGWGGIADPALRPRCRACRGTGRGKRPRTKRVVRATWRMDAGGNWIQEVEEIDR